MTVYNREKFVGAAIESVLAQTFTDFELIIVDDCSTDLTESIIDHYLDDQRIKFYRNEDNIGDYPNRNQAARYAAGKYLKYVDSDDLIYPECLKVMVSSMERFPNAALGISKAISDYWQCPIEFTPNQIYREQYLGTLSLDNAPTSTIIRTDHFQEIGGFDERRASDSRLWLSLAQYHSVVLLESGLTWWRQHSEQQNELYKTMRVDLIEGLKIHLDALNNADCPLGARETKIARTNVTGTFLRKIFKMMLNGDRRTALNALNKASLSRKDLFSIFLRSQWPYKHIEIEQQR